MKRVYALYRVSTLKQVEKNDIPMQKKSCRDFVSAREDWILTEEFTEKGVSGFKTSAKNRDAIQRIQQDAMENKFDVLLVFMFDRIGRKDDETPFIVEWFVNNNVEVWSVMEGEQKFDTHVDKLTNYIRYWQASGESIKTSIRTKTRMGQIVQEGKFKGGTPAYGYKLVRLGRVNKRNREVYDLAIEDSEVEVVKLIFSKYINDGLGNHRIATFLTDNGIMNRSGENFVAPTIRGMIKNPLYTGVLRSGDSYSEPFEHLQIISPEIFEKAQFITSQRRKENQESRKIPLTTKSDHLLSGNIFCGHCGARLIAATGGKTYTRKDGTITKRRTWRYNCHNRTRHKHRCDGQSGYNSVGIDKAINSIVSEMLSKLKKISLEDFVSKQYENDLKATRSKLAASQKKKMQLEDNLKKLKDEVVLIIQGESAFTPELINQSIENAEMERRIELEKIDSLTNELSNSQKQVDQLKVKYSQLIGWESIYDNCSNEQKKMIISQLIDRIVISRGGIIDVEFAISINQFLGKKTTDMA